MYLERINMTRNHHGKSGKLALEWCEIRLPIQVLQSGAGYYIATFDDEGPCSRESLEYFSTFEEATHTLNSGNWTQRDEP